MFLFNRCISLITVNRLIKLLINNVGQEIRNYRLMAQRIFFIHILLSFLEELFSHGVSRTHPQSDRVHTFADNIVVITEEKSYKYDAREITVSFEFFPVLRIFVLI